MTFHDSRIARDIEKGSIYGPGFETGIFRADSLLEQRNLRVQDSLNEGDISYGVIHRLAQDASGETNLEDLVSFFRARFGQTYSWRYKDWNDFSVGNVLTPTSGSAQLIGTGNGVLQQFQVFKNYVDAGFPQDRILTKLVAGTITVYINDVLQTITTNYTEDLVRGQINTVVAVPDTHSVKVNLEFDNHVRFASRNLAISMIVSNAGMVPSIPIVEVLHNGVDPL